MIRSLKVSAVALILALTSSYSLAADKVVVIPMGGSDVSAKEFDSQHVWSGRVSSTGLKTTPGWYTAERTSTGNYTVRLEVAHLKIPKIDDSCFPLATASLWSGDDGDTVRAVGLSCGSSPGIITSAAIYFVTVDSVNSVANKSFFFQAKFPDANLPGPAASLSSAETSLPDGVVCETVGDITTCTMGEVE